MAFKFEFNCSITAKNMIFKNKRASLELFRFCDMHL